MHSENEVVYLYLDDIIPNRFQPRELFDERALKELAVSIKEHGVIQPIIVRKNGEKYEIIAGERRYKASALAGLTKIPAIIRDLDDKESSKVALLENLQRKNLNPIEEAKTYQKILEIDQMTQEELAKTMGKSQSAVANKLRLLSLSEGVQEALLNAKISERHARTLLTVDDKEEQERLVKQIVQNRITVRELERMIKQGKEMQEEIEQEEPKPIDKPTTSEDVFKEPVFDDSSVSTSSAVEEESEEQKPPMPPMPDTMIDFDDVAKEINDGGDLDSSSNYKSSEVEKPRPPKFINYGEIDPDLQDEEDDDDDSPVKKFQYTSTPDSERIDNSSNVDPDNEVFFNEADFNSNRRKDNSSSLDSLLNIAPSRSEKKHIDNVGKSNESSSFDDVLNFDGEDDSYEYDDTDDYNEKRELAKDPKFAPKEEKQESFSPGFDESLFKTPTIEDFEEKNKVSSIKASSLNPSSYRGALRREINPEEEDEEMKKPKKKVVNSDIQYGINAIRDTVRKLEDNNLQIDTDEMNFENSYQIVIKIQKPSGE